MRKLLTILILLLGLPLVAISRPPTAPQSPGGAETFTEADFTTKIGTAYDTEAEFDALFAAKAPLADPTFTGTVTIPNDQIKSAMIDWADIGNLGEDGLVSDFTLTADADFGSFDVDNTDRLIGENAATYIDFDHTGNTLYIVDDDDVVVQAPDIRLGVDDAAYMSIVTTDGGETTISVTSDGDDDLTIGDNSDDNVIIEGQNWTVDKSGNATFSGTISAAANADPYYTFLDSGNPGTDKDIARIGGNFLSGADGAEDGALLLEAMLAGSQVLIGAWDSDEETWTFGDSGTGEDLIFDFETATDNQVSVSSNSGVTEISFSALNLTTTGTLKGGTPTVVDANPADGEIDAYCYGGVFFVSGTGTAVLPAVAAGMQVTIENHTADDVYIDPDGSEVIRLNGTALTAGFRIIGTDLGDGCVLTYYSAGVWSAFCSGYEDAGS